MANLTVRGGTGGGLPFDDDPRRSFGSHAVHGSEAWLILEALVTIIAAAMTIVHVLIRHPFKLAILVTLVAVFGTGAGWWTP